MCVCGRVWAVERLQSLDSQASLFLEIGRGLSLFVEFK